MCFVCFAVCHLCVQERCQRALDDQTQSLHHLNEQCQRQQVCTLLAFFLFVRLALSDWCLLLGSRCQAYRTRK